jgi:glycosyltransferase involved in cell wall biosynthesis
MPSELPLVTLGLPVHNGGAHLEQALRALQAQTWPRLEILISDNASTDGTEGLCRRIAAGDPRIRYVRQPENVGALRNFEGLVHDARGELFAWCAHDDLRMPRFVEACATELARRPDAVLCNSAVVFLDEEGRPRPDWEDRNFETRATTRPERAGRLIDHFGWVDMYGLVRRDALLRVLPIETVWGGDVVLSMKLLMLGEFAKVAEPLFHYRVRSRPKSVEQTLHDVAQRRGSLPRPYTEMIQALLRIPMNAAADRAERADVLIRFVRTIVSLEMTGPHPSWAYLLRGEHRTESDALKRWKFSRHVLEWLAPALPGSPAEPVREAMALLLSGAQRALAAVDGLPERIPAAQAAVDALAARLPGIQVALLCPASWLPMRSELKRVAALFPYDPISDRAVLRPPDAHDEELARVRAWRPDLVFDFAVERSRRLDELATASDALLSFAGQRRGRPKGPRRWFGASKRYDPNRRWSFVAPRCADVEQLLDFMDSLR